MIVIVLILVTYSSEVAFMPNYKERPDKWYLLMPMLLFYSLFSLQLLWNAVLMVKYKKVKWDDLVFTLLSIVCLTSLNNPKGNWQEVGYLGLAIVFIILLSFVIEKKRH
ncbi:MAG: hypothetical protein AAFV95_27765 [Bacteroidota bacterium]